MNKLIKLNLVDEMYFIWLFLFLICFQAKITAGEVIQLATIFTGNGTKHIFHLRRMVDSLLENSANTSLHLSVISDAESWPRAESIISNASQDHLR